VTFHFVFCILIVFHLSLFTQRRFAGHVNRRQTGISATVAQFLRGDTRRTSKPMLIIIVYYYYFICIYHWVGVCCFILYFGSYTVAFCTGMNQSDAKQSISALPLSHSRVVKPAGLQNHAERSMQEGSTPMSKPKPFWQPKERKLKNSSQTEKHQDRALAAQPRRKTRMWTWDRPLGNSTVKIDTAVYIKTSNLFPKVSVILNPNHYCPKGALENVHVEMKLLRNDVSI
jgi:hypothetical protein